MNLMKIKDLFHFEKGNLQSSKCIPGDYDFITAASDWKKHNEYTHDCEALIFAAAASGSLGRTHYVNGKFISSDLCFIITPKDPINLPLDLKFYHLIFAAFKDEIVRNTKAGTSKEAIGLKSFGNYRLPYFDIETQKETRERFVKVQKSVRSLDFELSHQLDLVKQLRQSFLREAMQGKLVPQNPNDELASVLLEKIKAEKERLVKEKKIKKQKPLPPLKEEEIPFEIPENWVWCRLVEIANSVSTGPFGTMLHKADYVPSGIPLINPMNLKDGRIIPSNKMMVNENTKQRLKSYILKEGDIVIGRRGEMGRCAVVTEKENGWLCGTGSFFLDLHYEIDRFFFINVLNADFTKNLLLGNSVGATMNNLNHRILNNLPVPIPPFNEQHRIVAKLDELMRYCDRLEEQIKTSQQQNDLLLQQVLREALQPQTKTEEEELPLAAELKVVYKNPKAHKVTSRKCDHAERAILAGHIINKTYREDFGRVKFQKLLHLTEYHCQIDIDSNYVQKVAGPYDRELIKDIESTLKRFRFFEIRESKRTGKRVTYRPLAAASELDNFFRKDFSKEAKRIDSLLNKFARFSYEECEIISTLYAVWNNRIIREQPVADDVLKQDFLEWDKHKAKYTDRLDKALEWMEKEDIIPVGWGKLIEKPVVQE